MEVNTLLEHYQARKQTTICSLPTRVELFLRAFDSIVLIILGTSISRLYSLIPLSGSCFRTPFASELPF